MMTLYCDESHDAHTYALAGWLGTPTGWGRLDADWRGMLRTIEMPDGGPCPAFHASEIAGRDFIKGSRFKGWAFTQEVTAFTKAADVIVRQRDGGVLWPVGCAMEVPTTFHWLQRDAIWLLLFLKLFHLLVEKFPAQRGISFVFDEKPEIASFAAEAYRQAKTQLNSQVPDYLLSTISFARDEEHGPLQAADFLAYEWRKRISDSRLKPDKVRVSYQRIRGSQGALWRYGREMFDRALSHENQSGAYADLFVSERPTHLD